MPLNEVDVDKRIISAFDSLNAIIEQQWTAINSLLTQQLIGPALILIYTTIDIMTSLSLEEGKQFNTRTDFKRWVKRYLLPNSDLSCSADDLYGARCGLLHSGSPESRSSHGGEAVMVWYAWGDADETILRKLVDPSGRSIKIIHVQKLFYALMRGTVAFLFDAQKDFERQQLIFMRAQKLFVFLNQGDAHTVYKTLFGDQDNEV